MERVKHRRNSRFTYLAPAAQGWRVRIGGQDAVPQMVATLEEAWALIPAEHLLHWAVPTDLVLMERMRLPAVDREELTGMMRLQLEKSLPFSADEVTSDLEVLSQSESESSVLACAINNEQLNALSRPLRGHQRVPEKMTPFAMHIAESCDPAEIICNIYPEEGEVVMAIAEKGRLGYAHSVHASTPADFFDELPQLLLSAELDGVPVAFTRVRLESELTAWTEPARAFFQMPVETFSLADPLPEPDLNLVPPGWHRERERLERAARFRSQLVLVGVAYLLMLLVAAGAILWMRNRVTKLDREVRETQPAIDEVAAQKARWSALAPAIDPGRYVVEVLWQVTKSLPKGDVRITAFEQTLAQFMVEAEAPTAGVAAEFGENLKNNPELQEFTFQTSPPANLPNNRWQLRVYGKP